MTHNLDFSKVEMLRRHLLLNSHDMALVLGISRSTYYNWKRGKNIRSTNTLMMKRQLKKMLAVITQHGWPTSEVLGMEYADRKKHLLALLGEQ